MKLLLGGNMQMTVPGYLMDTIDKGNLLHGIDLKSPPKKNPDGSHDITMTPKQYQQFEDNQRNPPPQKPSNSSQPSPAEQQKISPDQPSQPDDSNISVTKDPSTSMRVWLNIQYN